MGWDALRPDAYRRLRRAAEGKGGAAWRRDRSHADPRAPAAWRGARGAWRGPTLCPQRAPRHPFGAARSAESCPQRKVQVLLIQIQGFASY